MTSTSIVHPEDISVNTNVFNGEGYPTIYIDGSNIIFKNWRQFEDFIHTLKSAHENFINSESKATAA